jgi:hypothetical protein
MSFFHLTLNHFPLVYPTLLSMVLTLWDSSFNYLHTKFEPLTITLKDIVYLTECSPTRFDLISVVSTVSYKQVNSKLEKGRQAIIVY